MLSLALMSKEETKKMAKIQVMAVCNELMPNGVPDFKKIPQYQSLTNLKLVEGIENVIKILHVLVADFCSAFNVVRNMSEDQVIEAAGLLLDECGNFRLEDYVMMFTMAKRGQLIDVRDRIDVQMIGKLLDAYWLYRDQEGKKIQEREIKAGDNAINAKDITFAPVVSEAMTRWLKELPPEEQKEINKSGVEAYARLNNVNMEEVLKQFSKTKNNAA